MSEKRVTTDELEAIAFDEGGRISLGLSEARYTDAGGVHYVAELPEVHTEDAVTTFEAMETMARTFRDGPRAEAVAAVEQALRDMDS